MTPSSSRLWTSIGGQAGGEQRQRDQRLDHHRVGVGEDAALGIELIAVEEIARGRQQRVAHPLHAPEIEEDVLVLD